MLNLKRFLLALVVVASVVGFAVVQPTSAFADCGEGEEYRCELQQVPLPEGYDASDFEDLSEEEVAHFVSMLDAGDQARDTVYHYIEQKALYRIELRTQ